MIKRSYLLTAAMAAVVTAAVSLAACGGASLASNSGAGGTLSPVMMSAGDAPLSSVVAALVTVSSVELTNSSGSVSILTKPRKVELTHLGGVREPLELAKVAAGTYTGVSVTVTAAKVTYLDPATNQPVTTNATIPSSSGTATLTFKQPLTIGGTAETDLRFDFNLQKSLDLTGTTVTFTPVLSAAVGKVESESESERELHINGTVTAVDTTANTVTLTTSDSGMSVTLNVTANTKFGGGLALNTLQVGTTMSAVARLNPDGSLTAIAIDAANGGESEDSNSQVDRGLVTAVTLDTNNTLTSFTMVVQDGDMESELGHTLTVQIGSGTTYTDTAMAESAGLATFDATDIFPGQGVRVAGTNSTTADTVVATQIYPAAVNPYGLVSAAVQTTSGGLVIPLTVNNQVGIAKAGGISALDVTTNSATTFDGNGLTATTAATLATGTPLVARGYLSQSGSSYTLFASHVRELEAGDLETN